MSAHSLLKPALLASALGALILVPAAQARDDGRYNDAAYSSSDTESVTVYAPHFHVDRSSPLGAPDRVSLSRAVPYNDLDLRSPQDAHELRVRVATAAREICDQLQDATQTQEARDTSCYRTARENAMVRVRALVSDARNNDDDDDR